MMRQEGHLTSVALPPQNPQPQSHQEKNIGKTQTEGYSTKSLTSDLQNCQGHPKQGKQVTVAAHSPLRRQADYMS